MFVKLLKYTSSQCSEDKAARDKSLALVMGEVLLGKVLRNISEIIFQHHLVITGS